MRDENAIAALRFECHAAKPAKHPLPLTDGWLDWCMKRYKVTCPRCKCPRAVVDGLNNSKFETCNAQWLVDYKQAVNILQFERSNQINQQRFALLHTSITPIPEGGFETQLRMCSSIISGPSCGSCELLTVAVVDGNALSFGVLCVACSKLF